MSRRLITILALTVLYLGGVALVIRGPRPFDQSEDGWVAHLLDFFGQSDLTSWITFGRLEFMANILFFIPVGILFLLLVGRRLWFVAAAGGVALTVAIEVVQGFLPGRVSDISDIVANSMGTCIGVALALIVSSASARRSRRREVTGA